MVGDFDRLFLEALTRYTKTIQADPVICDGTIRNCLIIEHLK